MSATARGGAASAAGSRMCLYVPHVPGFLLTAHSGSWERPHARSAAFAEAEERRQWSPEEVRRHSQESSLLQTVAAHST
eukprot:1065850-Pleurochrysis_carterae.AAC.2